MNLKPARVGVPGDGAGNTAPHEFCSTSFASERVPASARCPWGASNRNQNFHLRGYGARVKNFIDITALAAHRLRGWRNGGSQCCRLLRPWRHRSDVRWTGSRLGSVLGALRGGPPPYGRVRQKAPAPLRHGADCPGCIHHHAVRCEPAFCSLWRIDHLPQLSPARQP
jgi:hypothetical protein